MSQDIYLTGITTTGTPHIGNYVGAIRPGIAASKDSQKKNYYFLADFHALRISAMYGTASSRALAAPF